MSAVFRLQSSTGHVAEAGLRGHGTVSGTILQTALTVYDDPVSLTGG